MGADFCPLDEFERVKAQIVVNTTPVGMSPAADATPVPKKRLASGMVVMDAIYNPVKTRLLVEAEERGCTTVDGVAMFVYQGARQFEWWTGLKAPVADMRRSVLAALTA
jgi:shikimate dehydrogenase